MDDDFVYENQPLDADELEAARAGTTPGLLPDRVRVAVGVRMTEEGVARIGMLQMGFECPVHGMEYETYALPKSLVRELISGLQDVEKEL